MSTLMWVYACGIINITCVVNLFFSTKDSKWSKFVLILYLLTLTTLALIASTVR